MNVVHIFEMGRINLTEFPLYQIAYRDQGGLTSIHLIWLCSESVQILSGSVGLLELRELHGTEELKTAGPEKVGF